MFKLMIAAVALLALAATSNVVQAQSVEEHFDFINMVVSFLNNREVCTLPAYSEVDEVSRRLRKLEDSLTPFVVEQRLTPDQQLMRETLLDQWDSFRLYLTSKNVLKSAIKRSFLGKVEKYQVQKFGESICTRNADTRVLDDPTYEKNPLVRYVKRVGGQGGNADDEAAAKAAAAAAAAAKSAAENQANKEVKAPATSNDNESDNDVELKFKVHSRDASGAIQSSKQYVTKFNFDASRPQNRITLHIGERK